MAAFDLTTKPTSLTLKPGSAGSIIVVVSNRLGKPVMAMVEGVLSPASASRWLAPPADLQRRYEADPAATVNYEFKINVPKDASAQAVQFKASVRDVMAPDDTRVEGQTVGINVSADDAPVEKKRAGVPWWVWAAAGVVVLGVGFGIFMAVRPKGVPKVVGMTVAKASAELHEAGFAPTIVEETVEGETEDINRVVRQQPRAKSRLPTDSMKWKVPATIVVNRESMSPPTTGRTDLAVWRPSQGRFFVIPSVTGTAYSTQWGDAGDVPVVRDYDGDGRADLAVWRPATGLWLVVKSSDGLPLTKTWGALGDRAAPADFDGDGKTDMAVWRPATGEWFVMKSKDGSTVTQQWGAMNDVPAPGDYDGDGRADFVVWRPGVPGLWYFIKSATGDRVSQPWGEPNDIPIPADYDGDKRIDVAIWRPSTAEFWVSQSTNGATIRKTWGQSSDIAIPRDYDGDGRADLAVWSASSGTWKINKSTDGSEVTERLGENGDVPAPADFDAAPK